MAKRKQKEPLWLDWEGRGYFGVPPEPVVAFPRADPLGHASDAWISAFQHARRGDFRYVPELIALVESDQLHYNTVARLIGDAAPSQAFGPLREFVASGHWNFELTFAWCEALSLLGRLGDVPLLIDAYEANVVEGSDEQDIILLFIKRVVDDGCGIRFGGIETHGSVDEYRSVVLEHCRELATRYGGEDVLLWRGAPRSVRRVAEGILAAAHGKLVSMLELRPRFEAWTGIDCTPMFDRDGFKPLEAAAIVEAFLESPAVEQFQDGRRYFFGHPVP